MIWIALGLLLLGFLVGGARVRRAARVAGGLWRPGAGMLALAAFVAAAVLAVREAFLPAALLAIAGAAVAMGARRTRRAAGPAAPGGDMSIEAASSILGVAPDASDEAVQAAYLRLIRRTHPDQGGTTGLAAQLNAARDAMLRRPRP